MGILNVTPDSFSDGGRYLDPAQALARALEMEAEGADLIDIGAESTRPGAAPVSEEEEKRRLWPVLEALAGKISVPISIDTTKAAVAAGALERGGEILNDVGAKPEMWPVAARFNAGYVLMHSRGTPQTMQGMTDYGDVTAEVAAFLKKGLAETAAAGINPAAVVCDPGFGFAKTAAQNIALLRGLEAITALGRPVLVGLSRKSFLKSIAGEGALPLSTGVAEAWAAWHGAHLWRTHNVRAARAAALLVESLAAPSAS
jgi:dihydropteroate synthase